MADQRATRAPIVWGVLVLAATVAMAWGMYLARGALLLIYVTVLLGVLGAVLAVPTAAIIQVIVQALLDERDSQVQVKT